MSDTFQTIIDRDAAPRDAPGLARPVVEWLVAEGIVRAEPEPGWALSDDPAHPPGPNWHKAVAEARWGAPEGLAVYTEHHIFHSLNSDDCLAFAHLGFEFWNWRGTPHPRRGTPRRARDHVLHGQGLSTPQPQAGLTD
ncbi:hypothetical protein [Streptomyces griseus]|uniref:hypothetical protein n=1 Tax=Streptomyces griseus TaxID=1911 RepID=UPI00068A2C50|nr:hypothetical protein [Streptomyces griseus]